MVQFSWVNQEDSSKETTMSDYWYEVLSVLHLLAMLSLSQANLLLLPKVPPDGSVLKVAAECRKASIDVFLRAAGYLEFAVQHVLPQFPFELRKDLPLDLTQEVLQALSLQALGQGVNVQLGMAIDSLKATLAVKRRLACEMVTYLGQAHESIMDLPLANRWGEKHKLFIDWKYIEAKAVAYYFHGLILNEGNTEKSSEMAAAALQTAHKLVSESKKACESFHMMPPISRSPPLWDTSMCLAEKIPRDIASKVFIKQHFNNQHKIMQAAPVLPDFVLSLKPDEYRLPPVDPSWNNNVQAS
ncbi:uncharacterized protein LOC110826239 [Carica papaya]|uniref:uncharacterized protein LOC110826239 n=1 Tax=Carica papaya TaxID=3649 RepID=UPI000B8CD6B6|nr:uncharacterized protein LOC110826239 [Carica papaya]XP_021912537.1 uncharacterized protein LOC110826239 [Carica papaya]